MTILNDETVAISTFAELKSIIEMTSSITIPQTKTNLIIDGTYNDIGHTFKDHTTLNAGDTIIAFN